MATFTGTDAGESITPEEVSATVVVATTPGGPVVPSAAVDIINSGGGDDTVDGAQGNDQIALGGGDDLVTWNTGGGNDRVDGNEGFDTLVFNGSDAAERVVISDNGGRVRLTDTAENTPNVILNLGGLEIIQINTFGGDDGIDAREAVSNGVALNVSAGAGSDTIFGGVGNDTIAGGAGNDSISGGAGNDVFRWSSGDGEDTISGDAGSDRLLFSGDGAEEAIVLSDLGSLVHLTRLADDVDLYLADVERTNINTFGGRDLVDASALSDNPMVLRIHGGGSSDTIIGGANADTLFGDSGNDSVSGSSGDDSILGGDGDDILTGDAGNDTLNGGAGDDFATGSGGADEFLIENSAGSDTDRISDFSLRGGDSLVLDYTTAQYNSASVTNFFGRDMGNPFIAEAMISVGGDTIIITDGAASFTGGSSLNDLVHVLGDALILL